MGISDFQLWVDERWKRNPRPEDLAIMTIGLGGETGEVVEATLELVKAVSRVSEPIKKQIRGSKPVDRTALIKEIGDVQHYLVAIANQFDIHMGEVLDANVAKLEARAAAGDRQGRA